MIIRWGCIVCVAMVMLLCFCAGGNKLEKQRFDCTERVAKAIDLYKMKKYSSVIYRLEDTRTQCSGSSIMDTVLYYLGLANLKSKKYVEARTEFQRLVQEFPGSPFFDEAKFRIGYAVYKQSNPANRDQKETREAMRLLDDFIESFPRSAFADSAIFYRTEAYEKLALKEFNNAVFYVNFNEAESAIVYYKTFMAQFADSRLIDQARYNTIELLVKGGRMNEALELRDELMTKGKNKGLQKAANALVNRIGKTMDGKK
jgi:outer membrane protein assembly factor BamD